MVAIKAMIVSQILVASRATIHANVMHNFRQYNTWKFAGVHVKRVLVGRRCEIQARKIEYAS
jgi:hypothetical protein